MQKLVKLSKFERRIIVKVEAQIYFASWMDHKLSDGLLVQFEVGLKLGFFFFFSRSTFCHHVP